MEDEAEPKTSDFYQTDPDLPERFNHPSRLRGYNSSAQVHPLYRTSNQSYGSTAPTVHHMPTRFVALSSRFSEARFLGGMFVDSSLNTSLDKSRVSMATARPRGHTHLPFHHSNDD